MKILVLGISAGLALAAAAPAGAQTLQAAWNDCTGQGEVARVRQINGCSGVLSSGLERPGPRAVALFNRAVLYQGQGAVSQALADYDAAIDLDPGLAQSFAGRASAYFQQADYVRAGADYDRAIRLDPRAPDGWAGRAAVRLAEGRGPDALADYDRAIALAPPSPDLLDRRGAPMRAPATTPAPWPISTMR